MPSKFEMQLFPPLTAVVCVGALAFLGAVYLTSVNARDRAPFTDVYSPDGQYVAEVENHSAVNLVFAGYRHHIENVAQGDGRIASVRWLTPRRLEISYTAGGIKDPGDARHLARERSRFLDVQLDYRFVEDSRMASR